MKQLLIWFIIVGGAAAQCLTVTADKILVLDLAKAIPDFGEVAPQEVLSFAPSPGLTRTFHKAEILMFARRFHIALNPESVRDVCFMSAASALTEQQVRNAIVAAVPAPVVSIEILDFCRSPLPPGRLEFRETGLAHSSAPPSNVTLWRGRVATNSGHSYPIWAKLRIVVQGRIVVSNRDIGARQSLAIDDVVYTERMPFPLPDGVLDSIQETTGRIAVRNISKGSPITKNMLAQPWAVRGGDTVHVDVSCGEAHLSFEARAETPGRLGELITVRNPNGRSFRATVVDIARVEVRPSTGD